MFKFKSAFSLSLFLTSVFVSQFSYSWGQTGHRISGEIAERHLKPEVRKKIDAIIGTESLAEASTYADEQRSNPSEFWQKTASPFHYVTVKSGTHYHESMAPPQGDAFTAIKKFTDELTNNNSTKEQKALALKFLVHLIGDLHQPLHAGNGTDRGGNDFRVSFFRKMTNLHRVWDSELIDEKKLSYTEWTNWLDRTISDKEKKEWYSIDPKDWIHESVVLRNGLYPYDDQGKPRQNISWDYNYQHLPTIKTRLKQAGIRIADYLNHHLSS